MMINDWWLMIHAWWLMFDDAWLLIDDSWFVIRDSWLIDDWRPAAHRDIYIFKGFWFSTFNLDLRIFIFQKDVVHFLLIFRFRVIICRCLWRFMHYPIFSILQTLVAINLLLFYTTKFNNNKYFTYITL